MQEECEVACLLFTSCGILQESSLQTFTWNPLYKSRIVVVGNEAGPGMRRAWGSTGLSDHAGDVERTQWHDLPSGTGTKPRFLVGSEY